MSLIAFLFGMVLAFVIGMALVLMTIYNILYHSVPQDELRAFLKDIRTAVRLFIKRKNKNRR